MRIVGVLVLAAALAAAGKPGAQKEDDFLEPYIYKEDFELGELNAWASYPPNQDTAYDPYIYPGKMKPEDRGLCLVAKNEPLWNEDQEIGAVKLLDMMLDKDSYIRFRYYIKSIEKASALKVHIPLKTGKRLTHTIADPALNRWAEAEFGWNELDDRRLVGEKDGPLRIAAVAVTAEIPNADTDVPIYFGLDDIEIRGRREKSFEFIEPEVVVLTEWKERIPLKHYASGGILKIKGKLGFEAEKVECSVSPFTDRDRSIYRTPLVRDSGGFWVSPDIPLGKTKFPPGLYRGIISVKKKNQVLITTAFTLMVISENAWKAHPRLLFDRSRLDEFRTRLNSENFRSVLERVLGRAKSYRDKIDFNRVVYDIDQFPAKDWVPSFGAWHTDRFMTYRESLFTNAIAHVSGKDVKAGEFVKKLLLKVAPWPQWNHPWMEARGFHTYYPLGEFADAYAVAYDLTYDLMDEAERKIVREGLLRNFIIPAYKTYVEDNQITSNSSNWISHIAGGALDSMMAFYRDGEDTRNLEPWLTGFILKEHRYITTVFGKDGSYGEGYRYYNFAMQSFAKTLPALLRLFNIDLTKRLVGSHLETLWSAIVPKNIAFTFGDTENYLKKEAQAWWIGGESGPMNNWAWLLAATGDPSLDYLYRSLKELDTLQEVVHETGGAKPFDPSTLGTVKFFPDVGTAVFKSGWGEKDFIFVFRSGPFFNHQHMDQGSFYLADHGEIFLEERYDGEHHYYDDPVYRTHAIQPISHNTILIDRNPQSQKTGDPAGFAPGMNDQARFESWVDAESFSFVRGSLEGVYKGTVKELRRNVLYIKPRTILLVDEIVPGEKDVEANLLFHTTWKKDISIEDDFVRFQKGPSSLFLFPCSPQDTVKNLREKPHFLFQYFTQPLITRGYLELSAKTSGRKLVAANVLTATADGRVPRVKVVREKDRVLIETASDRKKSAGSVDSEADEKKTSIAVNTGAGGTLGETTSDGLILAADDSGSVFMASGTNINTGSLTILRSDKPITANIKIHRAGIDINCHLSAGPALLTVSCVRKPQKVLVNHKSSRFDTYDSKSHSLKLEVPPGEGTIKLLW